MSISVYPSNCDNVALALTSKSIDQIDILRIIVERDVHNGSIWTDFLCRNGHVVPFSVKPSRRSKFFTPLPPPVYPVLDSQSLILST